MPGGMARRVTFHNRKTFCRLVEQARTHEFDAQVHNDASIETTDGVHEVVYSLMYCTHYQYTAAWYEFYFRVCKLVASIDEHANIREAQPCCQTVAKLPSRAYLSTSDATRFQLPLISCYRTRFRPLLIRTSWAVRGCKSSPHLRAELHLGFRHYRNKAGKVSSDVCNYAIMQLTLSRFSQQKTLQNEVTTEYINRSTLMCFPIIIFRSLKREP